MWIYNKNRANAVSPLKNVVCRMSMYRIVGRAQFACQNLSVLEFVGVVLPFRPLSLFVWSITFKITLTVILFIDSAVSDSLYLPLLRKF